MCLLLVLITQKGFVRGHFGASNLHTVLAQSNLPDSILEKHLRFLRTGKLCLLGGVGKVLSAAWKHYSNLLLISQNKIVKYEWASSSRRPQETPASTTPNPLQHSPSSSVHMLLHLHCAGTTFKSRWRQSRSIYPKLPICYCTKEITTSS